MKSGIRMMQPVAITARRAFGLRPTVLVTIGLSVAAEYDVRYSS